MTKKNSPSLFIIFIFISSQILWGCGAAVVGGAAYGTYTGAKENRSIGTILDDAFISTRVKSGIINDDFVSSRNIDVDVLNGIVFLIGVVESASQKRMAADIARGVEGVRKIENQLIVGTTTAGQTLDDTILTSKIRAELIKTPGIKSTNIDVDTNNGTISLTGVITSVTEREKILFTVQNVVGQRRIINNLLVND